MFKMRITYMAKPLEVERKWHLIDADGKTLGRLASEAAALLRGKHKPEFTPHIDTGDFVIVINAEKIVLTGKKLQQKKYYTHSHYPGGLKTTTAAEMINKKPHRIIELAVYGMLPKNKLGAALQGKLKVYAGSEHPHQAQQPEVYELRG
jgi:large subunit ribosomal protein L13